MEKQQPKSLAVLLKEIDLLLEYGAPKGESARLRGIIDNYSSDAIALNVFHNFYSYLPEGLEDGILKISRVANRHGAFLFSVSTLLGDYLYLATRESAALIGPFAEGIHDQDILGFFGWQDNEQFKKTGAAPAVFVEHVPLNESPDLCPVCGTGDGDIHAFGCPVEICPWCDGQLTNCDCRFRKTGRDKLSQESHLEELLDLLTEKGRIPYVADHHRPSFLDGKDLD